MDGYTLNAARTIREYESSIQRPKAERTINDSILSALLRGDELPEMDVKAIRQYGYSVRNIWISVTMSMQA